MNRSMLMQLLKDFHVKTEEQLTRKLLDDWDKVECVICKKKISILKCRYSGGDPICKNH